MRHLWLVVLPLLARCTSPLAAPPCEWSEPVIVTGLSGYIDEVPATEILLLAPDTCDTLDRQWMRWDDAAQRATLPEVLPAGAQLDGGGITTDPTLIGFERASVFVELRYPDPEAPGDALTFAWFATSVMDLSLVDCAAAGITLDCSVRAP